MILMRLLRLEVEADSLLYLLVGKNKTRMELVVDLLEVVLVEVELERNYKHLMEEIDLTVVDQ